MIKDGNLQKDENSPLIERARLIVQESELLEFNMQLSLVGY